jgi:hypothetical protein
MWVATTHPLEDAVALTDMSTEDLLDGLRSFERAAQMYRDELESRNVPLGIPVPLCTDVLTRAYDALEANEGGMCPDKDDALRALIAEHEKLTSGDYVTIPRPRVPYGPAGLTPDQGTARYLREVASKIERGYARVGGRNVTDTVLKLLGDTAEAIDSPVIELVDCA